MDCQDGVGAAAAEDRSKVASETKLVKHSTWVFVEKESVTDLREQILKLVGHACHEEQEKLRTVLLEKLTTCKRETLIELCCSFDIIGSRANRKEELVSFLIKFTKDHSSGFDGTNPVKKIKKRRRIKEEETFSSGKPIKKKKGESTALEHQSEGEAEGRKGVEEGTNCSDCDLMDNRYVCADTNKGKFSNGEANLELSKRINSSMPKSLDGVILNEAQTLANEQALPTTPSPKFIASAEGDSTSMKASKKKNPSVIKKKATPKEDRKVKSCGKWESRGDANQRKQALKPSKDELREAIFLILDTADFATMTFGEVVKEVDKYFEKDLFERKPLIRSLIEEELFRLAEEAEKKELEEEELAEAKARSEQAAKERAKDKAVESGIDKLNELQADQDGKTEHATIKGNDDSIEKVDKCGASVDAADNANSSDAAEGSQDENTGGDTKNGNHGDEFTKAGNCEMETLMPACNVKGDNAVSVQCCRNGKAETEMHNNVGTLEGSKNSKTKEIGNGENDCITEKGRSVNGSNSVEDANCYQAEEKNNERADGCAEDGKPEEAHNNENGANGVSHGDKGGEAKQGNVNTEQIPTDADGDGTAEDAAYNANTKVDVDSCKNGAAENGKAEGATKANSDSIA